MRSSADRFRFAAQRHLNSIDFLNPEHSQADPELLDAIKPSSMPVRLDRLEAEDVLLYISRRLSPTSRDLQEIILCLLPGFNELSFSTLQTYCSENSVNHATKVSNLLPSSLCLTHGRRPFLKQTPAKLMRYSPCIQACEPPSSQFSTSHPTAFEFLIQRPSW